MGYNIHLFHPDVRAGVEAGEDFEEFEHPALDKQAVADFIKRLEAYEYISVPNSPYQEFAKEVDGSVIEVRIFETEIGFRIAYGNSGEAIFDALMDASEMMDSEFMTMYDPQAGDWT